jgi:hypothetical protein
MPAGFIWHLMVMTLELFRLIWDTRIFNTLFVTQNYRAIASKISGSTEPKINGFNLFSWSGRAEALQYYSVKHFELRIWFGEKVFGVGLKVFSSPFPLNRQVLRSIAASFPPQNRTYKFSKYPAQASQYRYVVPR